MKEVEAIKIKGGFMGMEVLDDAQVKALSSLPSLPVIRAQLLGVLQAPAGKLASVTQAPAGQLARVFNAYATKE